MQIQIDKSKKTPLYRQITEQIQAQIISGEIPDGFQFPSERQLADTLGVNRTTVLNAYKELKADGLLASHVGRGTTAVRGTDQKIRKTDSRREPMWEYLFSDYLKNRDTFDVNKYLEMANQKDVISFAAGIASFENPPVRAFKGIEHELLSNPKGMLVSPVAGFSSLRKVMASYMQKRSCFCHPSEIMLVSGAQEGIDLAARAFLNPGDIVLIEEPSFFPAIQSFRSMGARLMAVPMEHDGMDVRILEQLLMRYHPKLIYTMPTYHNPCGVTMSTAKRVRLLELATKYSVPVLEDDPYSELSFEGQTTAPLKSMDTNGNVIYLSSFSKTIYPGLRLGWICADRKLIHHFSGIRQLIDLHSCCISQQIVERFIVNGEMEKYVELIRKKLYDNKSIFAGALKGDIYRKELSYCAGMLVLIFPLRKSIVQVSLWHGIEQHYNVFLQSVSFQDMHQRNRPSDKHILWHCKGHTGGIWNHASPCGNNSYLIARIDRWRETFLHTQVSYRRNQNG